jgi:Pyruvate/2-oxoacid:ferredoxin oxidoreductase delta subunit
VSQGTDAIEMLMAGASAVGVCTAAMLRGPAIFGKIAGEMATWLAAHGYTSPSQVRGLALGSAAETWAAGQPVVVTERCNGCVVCAVSCPYRAIEMVERLAVIDLDLCERCGLCLTRCRRDAIAWEPI